MSHEGWRVGIGGALVVGLLFTIGCGASGAPAGSGVLGPVASGDQLPTSPLVPGSGPLQSGPVSFLPPSLGSQGSGSASPIDYLNSLRAVSSLPPVSNDPGLVDAATKHARYMVANNSVGHTENPGAAAYTPEGAAAAARSNCFGSPNVNATFQEAIDGWIAGPFHAAGMLDPTLQRAAYGSHSQASGGLQYAACIDVVSGLDPSAGSSVPLPALWPGNGKTVSLTASRGEYPDPLTSCPGYTYPCGLPIYVILGAGASTPRVTAFSLSRGGVAVQVAEFDETSYSNPDAAAQGLARRILASRKMVVLIPRQPLAPGSTYSVSVTIDGRAIAWSFSISPGAV